NSPRAAGCERAHRRNAVRVLSETKVRGVRTPDTSYQSRCQSTLSPGFREAACRHPACCGGFASITRHPQLPRLFDSKPLRKAVRIPACLRTVTAPLDFPHLTAVGMKKDRRPAIVVLPLVFRLRRQDRLVTRGASRAASDVRPQLQGFVMGQRSCLQFLTDDLGERVRHRDLLSGESTYSTRGRS